MADGYPVADTQDGPGLSPQSAIKWIDEAIREHSGLRDDAVIDNDTPSGEQTYCYHKGYIHGLDDGRRMLLAVLDHLRWKEQTR